MAGRPKRTMAGRPTERTPAVRERLLRCIRMGMAYKLACDTARIGQSTFYEWQQDDPEFAEALLAAEGEGCEELISTIRFASAESWQAAAWILERRSPQLYGRRVHEIQGKDGAELKFEVKWAVAAAPKLDEEVDE